MFPACHIFTKLNVEKRAQTVVRAQSLGLTALIDECGGQPIYEAECAVVEHDDPHRQLELRETDEIAHHNG